METEERKAYIYIIKGVIISIITTIILLFILFIPIIILFYAINFILSIFFNNNCYK